MLVEEPHDRGRQHRCGHARRHEQEADQPQAGADGVLEGAPVLARRVARQEGKEDGRHRDREHALRQHVEAKGPHDRRRRDVRVQVVRREQLVDQGVDVDQTEPDRHRHHQHERPLHRRVADVDHHLQPAVQAAQPRQRQEELGDRRDEDRDRVDVELRRVRARALHPQPEAEQDDQVPQHRAQSGHGEVVVAVEDPDHDPGQPEDDHDREEDASEDRRDRSEVVRAVAEDLHHPRAR